MRPDASYFRRIKGRFVVALLANVVASGVSADDARAQWTQFGGPGQNFQVDDAGIARQWPADGPRQLWKRTLGAGYSSILANDGRLFTLYRASPKEVVICLDAATGDTVWEFDYAAPLPKGHDSQYGDGPNATPLLHEGRLYTIGVGGLLHCLEAATGKPLWSHDLLGEFGGNSPGLGYSSSPIEYKDSIIVLVGGKDQSIVAFDKEDGRVRWKNLSFENSFSTPRILRVCGEDQLVTCMGSEVIGADPRTGTLQWRYPIVNQWKQNITMPILLDDDLLFISTLEAGSRGLRLVKGEPFQVEELWSTRKVQCFYTSAVRIGDYVYASSGDSVPLMSAINARTGELAWRQRGFTLANLVIVGDRLVILDDEGNLALATPSPEGLTVHSKAKVLDPPARTAPTIAGHRLYARDGKNIIALDLR